MRYKSYLLLLALLLAASVVPALAQAEGNVFADPNGLFTLVIPTNWTAEAKDGYVLLTDPDSKLLVYTLVSEGDDVAAAVDEAWKLVNPDFEFKPEQTMEVPSAPGVEKTVILTATSEDKKRAFQGFGQVVDGKTYVQLYDVDLVAAQQRSAQLQVIATGLKINALEETDLSGAEALTLTPELIAALETYIGEVMEKLEVPGAAVAIVQNGEIVYEQGFGVRGPDSKEPITPDTLMMIGSTTKSFTTMMMATLVDEGLMDWDTKVVDILPTFAVQDPELTKAITVRNLVCACTGVPRRDLEWVFNSNTPQEIIESLAGYTFFTDFGEAFQYSNQMVATGGYVATMAAGGSYDNLLSDYEAQLQQRVLGPIGMPNTTFSFQAVESSGNYAVPYGKNLFGEYALIPLSVEEILVPIAPAGALWSNAHEMARYMITELNQGVSPDGERVVSAENLKVTWEPQVEITAEYSYGLGWIVGEYKGQQLIEHGGNTFGYTSDFAFLPDANLGVVVLTNGRISNIFNEAVRTRILDMLFQQDSKYDETIDFVLKTTEEEVAKLKDQLKDSYDPEAVAPYLGTFTNDILGDITISEANGKLMLDVGEFKAELLVSVNEDDETRYLVLDPPLGGIPLEFAEADGEPVIKLDIVTDVYIFTEKGA